MNLTSLAPVPGLTREQEDQIALLRSTMPDRLTRFCDRYLMHLDAAQAASEVGAPGQERTLLADRRVLQLISAVCGHVRENNAHVRAAMVGMLARMALWDVKDIVAPVGGFLPVNEWPDQVRMCVEQLDLDANGAIKRVRFTKRLDVMKMLLDLTGTMPAQLSAAHGRVIFEVENE